MENKTIKNNVTMFVFAVLSLVVMLGAAVVGTKIFTEAYALVGSAVLVAIAVVMHLLGSKLKINVFYSISLMLNAVAGGFGASSYFTYFYEKFDVLLAGAATLTVVLVTAIITGMVSYFENHKKLVAVLSGVLGVGLAVAAVIFWAMTNSTYFSYGFFALLWSIFYMGMLIYAANKNRRVFRDISLGGFGACAFVCIAALTIITEGDVGSEFFDGFVPEKKAKTKK